MTDSLRASCNPDYSIPIPLRTMRPNGISSSSSSSSSSRSSDIHSHSHSNTEMAAVARRAVATANQQALIRNTPKGPLYRLRASFFLLGLLNNSLYVVILTAALELLPKGVPTGVVALANIFPALVAKAVWPYLLKGKVRYKKRVWGCSALSFLGMLVIAFFPSLTLRLIGISMASFSSGLGELTYLQLSTRYESWNGEGVGYFASGTGAAGIVGSLLWWLVRPLGVQTGLTLLSVLPFGMLGSWALLLPTLALLQGGSTGSSSNAAYAPLSTEGGEEVEEERASREDEEEEEETRPEDDEEEEDRKLNNGTSEMGTADSDPIKPQRKIKLSFSDKMRLLKPMLLPYICPLVLVYIFEYTINQGIAPTLLYPLPTKSAHPLLSLIIKKLSDYYPLYQTIYQLFVFVSRSSVSLFHLPAIPKKFLWVPAIAQGAILSLLFTESLYAWFRKSINSPLVMVLICCEGLAGGAAYVSVFYSIGTEAQEEDNGAVSLPSSGGGEALQGQETEEEKRIKKTQEFEFRIGCVGFGDSLGILIAALVAMPLELWLCSMQAKDGRTLCKEV